MSEGGSINLLKINTIKQINDIYLTRQVKVGAGRNVFRGFGGEVVSALAFHL